MKYQTPEQVDERIRFISSGTSQDRHTQELDALVQLREMLYARDNMIITIEEVITQFEPIARTLNYWLCGISVHKWGGVTQDMLNALKEYVVELSSEAGE